MDFDTWKKEVDAKVAGIDAAIDVLKALRDSYSLQSYPYCLRGESSPAAIRRKMNSAWDKAEDGSK
jgi:hypothetical protein